MANTKAEERDDLLKEDARLKREATKEDKPHDTVPGYAGLALDEITPKGKVTIKDEEEEDVVIGQGGSVTRPTKVSSMPFSKEGNEEERFAGKVMLEGDTHIGYHYKIIVDVPQALTEAGLFHVFKSHYPDAVAKGFTFKAVSTEEAEKLGKEWQKEREGGGKKDSKAKEK